MKIDENGIIRDMTEAEIEQFEKEMEESAKNSEEVDEVNENGNN